LRYRWSLARPSFASRYRETVVSAAVWVMGVILVTILGPVLPDTNGDGFGGPRWWGYVHLSEAVLVIHALWRLVVGLREAASGGINPAILLISSFVIVISVGTL